MCLKNHFNKENLWKTESTIALDVKNSSVGCMGKTFSESFNTIGTDCSVEL